MVNYEKIIIFSLSFVFLYKMGNFYQVLSNIVGNILWGGFIVQLKNDLKYLYLYFRQINMQIGNEKAYSRHRVSEKYLGVFIISERHVFLSFLFFYGT